MNMFNLLCYKDLDASGLEQKLKKVCNFLSNGDFKSAEVKKLSLSGYLRAKLDDTNRLLFKMIKTNNGTHILLLEIIRNHNYDKSRFLRGAQVSEIHIQSYEEITANIVDDLRRLIKTRETKVMDMVADWFSEKYNVDIDEVSIYPTRKKPAVY